MLLGLLTPGRGQVQVYGRPPSQAVAAGLVGAMLQDAGLMPGVRVGELLAMVRGLYPRTLPMGDLVNVAGLGSLLGRRADQLSGGQAQRVRFAAAIAGDPQLLVLDEPTAAMDVQARRNFWKQIRGFAGRGRTVLFATHYLHEADDAADRVVVIAGGRKIADGPPPRSRPVRRPIGPLHPPPGLAGQARRPKRRPRRRPRPGAGQPPFGRHRRDRPLAAEQRAGLVRPAGRRARPGDIIPAIAGRTAMTGFMTLEMRRALKDVRYLIIAVAMPIGLYLLFTGLFGSHGQRTRGCPSRPS